MFTNINGRVTNKDGLVAMKYPMPISKSVGVPGGGYTFNPRCNVSMAWVKPEHVDHILSVRQTCCGGRSAPSFRLANESDVRVWEGIAER